MRHVVLIAAVTLLAACGQGDQPAAPAEPAPAPAPTATATTAPEALLGVWDVSAAACGDPASQDRITITAGDIRFWESGGKFTSVAAGPSGEVVADVAMSGEGEEWVGHYTFALTSDGKGFTLTFADQSMTRMKCP